MNQTNQMDITMHNPAGRVPPKGYRLLSVGEFNNIHTNPPKGLLFFDSLGNEWCARGFHALGLTPSASYATSRPFGFYLPFERWAKLTAPGHNPHGLANVEVGIENRLLTLDELEALKGKTLRNVCVWVPNSRYWFDAKDESFFDNAEAVTLRINRNHKPEDLLAPKKEMFLDDNGCAGAQAAAQFCQPSIFSDAKVIKDDFPITRMALSAMEKIVATQSQALQEAQDELDKTHRELVIANETIRVRNNELVDMGRSREEFRSMWLDQGEKLAAAERGLKAVICERNELRNQLANRVPVTLVESAHRQISELQDTNVRQEREINNLSEALAAARTLLVEIRENIKTVVP